MLVERMEVKVQHWTLVARKQRRIDLRDLALVLVPQDSNGATPSFPSQGKELGVGLDEIRIPCTACYAEVLIIRLDYYPCGGGGGGIVAKILECGNKNYMGMLVLMNIFVRCLEYPMRWLSIS